MSGFMARKIRKGKARMGALPSRKPNTHRAYDPNKGSSRSRPVKDERGGKAWTHLLQGRTKIFALLERAGIEVKG